MGEGLAGCLGASRSRDDTKSDLVRILNGLARKVEWTVLRAKGIEVRTDGTWVHCDYVPGEGEVRSGGADYRGRL